MLKDYALLGMNISYGNISGELQESIQTFDANLAELRKVKGGNKMTTLLQEVESQWNPIREILRKPPQKPLAKKLRQDLEQLLTSTHRVVEALEELAGSKAGGTVALSGRQRMLSQRMAALYAMGAWRVEGFEFMPEFKKVVSEFRTAQDQLLASSLTTPEIRKELEATERNFRWFEYSAKKESEKFIPSLILRAADQILKHMDKATRLYAKT
jgi:hypothetical protein